MCDPAPDPRYEIVYGTRALRGITDLIAEVAQSKSQFDIVGPEELSELLGMVEARLKTAAEEVQHFVPRGPLG